MVNVYTLEHDFTASKCLLSVDRTPEAIRSRLRKYALKGKSLIDSWIPFKVVVSEEFDSIDEPYYPNLPLGDYPAYGGYPVLSERAVDVLSDLLMPNGELLPLDYDKGKCFVFNTLRVIDAIDERNSGIYRHPTGEIIRVERPVFYPEFIVDESIFLVKQCPWEPNPYVTDRFVIG
ncbi:MAG: hypothetical protein HC921_04910 [Synechococcaceae cyanobacterium SM2_3_1]|nr:hypothetical protein [Synechococcaceae cyanobacterium SM2_3_1]